MEMRAIKREIAKELGAVADSSGIAFELVRIASELIATPNRVLVFGPKGSGKSTMLKNDFGGEDTEITLQIDEPGWWKQVEKVKGNVSLWPMIDEARWDTFMYAGEIFTFSDIKKLVKKPPSSFWEQFIVIYKKPPLNKLTKRKYKRDFIMYGDPDLKEDDSKYEAEMETRWWDMIAKLLKTWGVDFEKNRK